MNPNAQTKPGELGPWLRERTGPETCLIKYKLEPRIASAGGSLRGENNMLNEDLWGDEKEEVSLILSSLWMGLFIMDFGATWNPIFICFVLSNIIIESERGDIYMEVIM